MKNFYIKLILFLFTYLGSSTIILADAWTSFSKCNWFNNRYKVHVEIRRSGALNAYDKRVASDCDGVERRVQYPADPYGTNPFSVLYAYAHAIANGSTDYAEYWGGYDGADQWVAGSDVSNKLPDLSYQPIVEKMSGKIKRFSGGKIHVGKIIFDTINHTVQILDIQGKFNTKGFDKANDFSAFALSITNVESPDDDFSEETYMKRLVWTSRAMINNGRLQFDGNFEAGHFTTSYIDGVDEAGVNIKSLVIHLPKDVDMNRISVNTGLDNGNLGMGISSKFRVDNHARVRQISNSSVVEEEFNFTGFPNPSAGIFTVRIKMPTTQQIKVEVYDVSGNFIKSLYKGEAKIEEPLEIKTDLSNLLPGIYYIKLITSDKILVRKMIKK